MPQETYFIVAEVPASPFLISLTGEFVTPRLLLVVPYETIFILAEA